ncbi:MAG: hypothetical protein MJZ22_04245, partial [Candidatus Saccharibacteria bacterium]|nr:hypothetical protein [Candidatus Saccharibacteria bacterium]
GWPPETSGLKRKADSHAEPRRRLREITFDFRDVFDFDILIAPRLMKSRGFFNERKIRFHETTCFIEF